MSLSEQLLNSGTNVQLQHGEVIVGIGDELFFPKSEAQLVGIALGVKDSQEAQERGQKELHQRARDANLLRYSVVNGVTYTIKTPAI